MTNYYNSGRRNNVKLYYKYTERNESILRNTRLHRISGEFDIKSKTTLDEANAMQIAYVDTENKNSCVDGIRRAFICNVRQLNRLIQFHLSAFSFRGYHANIISKLYPVVWLLN